MSKAVSAGARGAIAGLALCLAALGLGGCGSSDDDTTYVEQPVEQLYNRALDALGQQEYKVAAKGFEEVGRYYQSNQQYVGAINRYRVVIERYQTTSHVPEALHRLVESYLSLGVKSEAQEAAAVLGFNFPGSDWYQDSYFLMTGEGTRPSDEKSGWFFGLF